MSDTLKDVNTQHMSGLETLPPQVRAEVLKSNSLGNMNQAMMANQMPIDMNNNMNSNQINNLLDSYQSGRLVDAENLELSLTKEFPNHNFSVFLTKFS